MTRNHPGSEPSAFSSTLSFARSTATSSTMPENPSNTESTVDPTDSEPNEPHTPMANANANTNANQEQKVICGRFHWVLMCSKLKGIMKMTKEEELAEDDDNELESFLKHEKEESAEGSLKKNFCPKSACKALFAGVVVLLMCALFFFLVTKTNCTLYIIHENTGDGFGHQLHDIASGMVYHFVNTHNVCYLGRQPYEKKNNRGGPAFGSMHNASDGCIDLYNALNQPWRRSIQEKEEEGADHHPTIPIQKFSNYWEHVLQECGEPRNETQHNPRCDHARSKVGNLFVHVAKQMAKQQNIPQLNIALHIRKGDFPRDISQTYQKVMDQHFPNATQIDVFTEYPGEASEILQQLSHSYNIVEHFGGDPLESWLLMARARVLFVHQSSFSVTAGIASEGIVFSQQQKPQEGRYDGNIFHCPTVGGWWMSFGHGSTYCSSEKLKATEQAVQSGN